MSPSLLAFANGRCCCCCLCFCACCWCSCCWISLIVCSIACCCLKLARLLASAVAIFVVCVPFRLPSLVLSAGLSLSLVLSLVSAQELKGKCSIQLSCDTNNLSSSFSRSLSSKLALAPPKALKKCLTRQNSHTTSRWVSFKPLVSFAGARQRPENAHSKSVRRRPSRSLKDSMCNFDDTANARARTNTH